MFEGTVSLERNGGFASVRSSPGDRGQPGAAACLIELRGDNKQFKLSLLTDDGFDSLNYQASFAPTGHRLADLAPAAGRLPRQLPRTRGHRRTAAGPRTHPPGRPDDRGTPGRPLRARHPAHQPGLKPRKCERGTARRPDRPREGPCPRKPNVRAGHHQVIEHPHVDQRQRRLQRLRQVLIGPARLDRTRRVVVGQDNTRGLEGLGHLGHGWVKSCRGETH